MVERVRASMLMRVINMQRTLRYTHSSTKTMHTNRLTHNNTPSRTRTDTLSHVLAHVFTYQFKPGTHFTLALTTIYNAQPTITLSLISHPPFTTSDHTSVTSIPVTHTHTHHHHIFACNWCVQKGMTALHYAVFSNHESMVPLLLEHNADIDIQEKVV